MSQANNMSTAIVIIPTYADAAKQKPPVVAATAPVADSIPTDANVNSTKASASNSLTCRVSNPASDVKVSNPASDVKVSNPASDARKMFNPATGFPKVSNNPMGRLPRKVKMVALPQKRKAPSAASLRNGRRRVARTARQEERKREMLLFDEEIKLIRGGGDGNERSHSGGLFDTDSEGETSITATLAGRKRTAPPTASI